MNESSVSGFLAEMADGIKSGSMAGHIEWLPARQARYRQPKRELHPQVVAALSAKKAQRTYTHQAEAIDAVMAGKNVVISTSTASGKSICFHAPVLDRLLRDNQARALYLFPTKALGHDQLAGLEEMMAGGGIDIECSTYDGDTPRSERGRIRANSRIVITNVDMLQVSTLPQHRAWGKFLRNLQYVVIDEAHYYRGVFGTHVAMIMRRLRRILRQLGANPQFILCSATIANPGEHAERLIGTPCQVVDSDGSPSGERAFVLLDSATAEQVNGSKGINMQAALATATLMRRGVRTLTFAPNRAGAERIVQYTQDYLDGRRAGRYRRPELRDKIKPYRAGYSAEHRRTVERELRSGELLAVASTNALELGVDIGSVSAAVIAGFPGTIASSWQQAGRCGRDGRLSVSMLLLRDNPVDSFYSRYPEAFFGAAHEAAQVNMENRHILGAHLECAAWEMPLTRQDFDIFGERAFRFAAQDLVNEKKLVVQPDGSRRLAEGIENPSFGVNIRSSDDERYALINGATGRPMEETTKLYALRELYPGAVYAHKGETYRVVSFSEQAREATLRYLNQRIYTQAEIMTAVDIIGEPTMVRASAGTLWTGKVRVTSRVLGYRERDLYATDDQGELVMVDMPALEYETMAAWFCARQPDTRFPDDLSALHSIAHVGTGALAMLTMCDRRDLGAVAMAEHPQLGIGAVFIFEEEIGGVGLVDMVGSQPEVFIDRMVAMVESCNCGDGCPSCIEASFCNDDTDPPTKEALLAYFGR